VDAELVRAIRTESSLALQYWFGVNYATVCKWRKAFGITQWGTDGSRRLHQTLSERGAAKLRGKKLPKALVKRRIEIRADKGFKMPRRWAKTGWQQWQLDLLGTAPDAELAERFGRTVTPVLTPQGPSWRHMLSPLQFDLPVGHSPALASRLPPLMLAGLAAGRPALAVAALAPPLLAGPASEAPSRPGECSCAKNSSLAEPCRAFHCRTRRSNVRRRESGYFPGCERCSNDSEIFSFHNGGSNALFGDGSVRFLMNDLTMSEMQALLSRAGGEVINFDY
jgi:prepilin-type processing-associated H-X9-DG protein